jgi:transposase
MTLSDVAELTLLSWDTVKAIVKTYLAKDYGKPFLKGVRYLGIDEIHVGKKGRFYTIVIDLEDGRILWAKPGRGGAALRGFWPRLRRAKAKIKAVATDNERHLLERRAGAPARRRSGLRQVPHHQTDE